MTLKTKKIAIPVYCPDCGDYKGPIFFKDNEKGIKNEHCKCHNKRRGLGFDISVKAVHVDHDKSQPLDLIYCESSCSGIKNEWVKNSVRCTVCKTHQFQIKNGDKGFNRRCKNPDCPTLGFDYGYSDNFAYAIASGIENDVSDFLNGKYSKSRLGQFAQIDRSNYCY